MSFTSVASIVNAVLYEGYMLYPYRPSSVKNRQRWTFGGIYPQAFSVAHGGSEPWTLQTQCLMLGGPDTLLEAKPGFLHLVEREAGELAAPLSEWPQPEEPPYRRVEVLAIDAQRFYTWQESVERQVVIAPMRLGELANVGRRIPFAFLGSRELEPLRNTSCAVVGLLARTQLRIEGIVELRAEAVAEHTFRITVKLMNLTPIAAARSISRDAATLQALASCHIILNVSDGEFLSLIDPPESLAAAAAACENIGVWPVLVGAEGSHDTMLASPIILYDYPQIAPESPGDLFDATEIDEILTLRILTMTEQEKREMAAVDQRSRALLERTERLTNEQLQRLHGTLRSLKQVDCSSEAMSPTIKAPWEELDNKPRLTYLRVKGVDLRIGDQVRLRPRGNADIFDLALSGKVATIESLERDFDDRVHVAVTLDDDPGRDMGLERMPGHRFFFSPDEVEPVAQQESRA